MPDGRIIGRALIAVQAGNAAHVRSPEHAYQALEVISQTSRAALNEMRGLLGVLHPEDVALAGWGWLASLALVSTVAAIGLFFAGLRRVGPTAAVRIVSRLAT